MRKILFLTLTLTLMAVLVAAVPSSHAVSRACGSGAPLLWAGLPHRALAGTDVYSDPANPGLVLSNIGSSGQDGVCVDLEPAQGIRSEMAQVMPGDNIVGLNWSMQGLVNNELIEAFRWQVSTDPFPGEYALIFTDGFESGDVSISLYDDGQLVATETAASGGEIATIHEFGALLSLKVAEVVQFTDVSGRSPLMQDMVVTTTFWDDLEFVFASGSYVGDELHLALAPGVVPAGYTATDDLWQFTAPEGEIGTARVDATYLKIDDAWHMAELGRLRSLQPEGPMGLLSAFPERNAFLTRDDLTVLPLDLRFTFLRPLRFLDSADEFITESYGSVEGGESQLLGSVAIKPVAGKPELCASFPDPAFGSQVLLDVLLNDVPVFSTSFENGGCFNSPRAMQVGFTDWNEDLLLTLLLGVTMQGVGDAVIRIQPSDSPTTVIDAFRHEHTRPQFVDLLDTPTRQVRDPR